MAFIAPLALGAGLLGGAVSAVGTLEQGAATANAANYAAQVAANNAIIANQNATYATAAGQQQAANTSLGGAQNVAKIKTAQAASGVDVNTGSAVDVQKSAREVGQLNTETVLNNAELQAYGYRASATGYQAQAGLYGAEAAQAPIGAAFGATGGLLSTISSTGLKWSQLGGNANPFAVLATGQV